VGVVRRPRPRLSDMRSYVVTGASTGIGRATALLLDRGGARVFASVRNDADAESLGAEGSDRLMPIRLDVTDRASIAAAASEVENGLGDAGLDGLVNNAGSAIAGPLEFLPIDDFRQQLEINLVGHLAVTQAFLPRLRRARGRLVFLSSIGGRIALPFNGPYHASKFGIEAIGDSLRQELAPSGVKVILIEPGSVATPIWSRARERGNRMIEALPREARDLYEQRLRAFERATEATERAGIEPRVAAEVIVRALTADRPATRYLVGSDAKVNARVRKLMPDRLFDRLIARRLERAARG
jgi:NAD(P)-dependent dehydrogenase (short-subunit alcohol dehydrogenase family)